MVMVIAIDVVSDADSAVAAPDVAGTYVTELNVTIATTTTSHTA